MLWNYENLISGAILIAGISDLEQKDKFTPDDIDTNDDFVQNKLSDNGLNMETAGHFDLSCSAESSIGLPLPSNMPKTIDCSSEESNSLLPEEIPGNCDTFQGSGCTCNINSNCEYGDYCMEVYGTSLTNHFKISGFLFLKYDYYLPFSIDMKHVRNFCSQIMKTNSFKQTYKSERWSSTNDFIL